MTASIDLLQLGLAALLVIGNAFFVLVEFAIVKVRVTRLEELCQKGNPNALVAREMVGKLDEYLSACQLGITMASLGLGWLGEPALARRLAPLFLTLWPDMPDHALHTTAFLTAFTAITAIHVVLGELAPKSVAIQRAERSALWIARPMRWFYRLFYGPLKALNWVSNQTLRLIGFTPPSASETGHSEEELRMLISRAEEHGRFALRRLLLFENVFDFGQQRVKDAMTARENIDYLSLKRNWEENLAVIRTRRQTRYPLCEDSLDHPVGYVHIHDLLAVQPEGAAAQVPDLLRARRELPVILEDELLEKVLSDFQRRGRHLALVKNAAGAVAGLLTLEDILEELVGEIRDEFEAPPGGSLSEYWVPEAFDPKLEGASRSEVIARLLERLHAARPEFDRKAAYDAIWKREQGLTSAIGKELALPHGRLHDLSKPLIAIALSQEGIPFEAPDGRPVKVVFLILTPLKEPAAQLRILANIAHLMSNSALRRRLQRSRGPAQVGEILRSFEAGIPA